MSQIEVTKISEYVAFGPPADSISVPKLSMYILLVPGDDGSVETSNRQGHVYAQKLARD